MTVAFVTGVSSGFGLEAAIALAQRGVQVFGTVRSLARAQSLLARAGAAGVHVELVEMDVTDTPSINRAVSHVVSRAGHIDVLVNNAGIAIGGFFEDQSPDDIRAQFETNVFGTIEVTRAVLPSMRATGKGRILNVSSIGGRIGTPGLAPYCASKFALEGFSESLRHELRPLGIDVVLLEPGTYPTAIFFENRRVAALATSTSRWAQRMSATEATLYGDLERRKADPADVGRAIARLTFARNPPLRTTVGADARQGALALKLLPQRWFDALMALFFARPA